MELEMDEKILAIQRLDAKLRTWRHALPDSFDSDHYQAALPAPLSQRALIDIVYHQSMSVLHSSIVPLFSLTPVAGEHGYAQTLSAQTALYHARRISGLFHQLEEYNVAQAPGFIGYAAYCSCAIQLPFIWCSKAGVRERSLCNIGKNMEVMDVIGRHWKLVAGLVRILPEILL